MQPDCPALYRATRGIAMPVSKVLLHPWTLFTVVALAVWWPEGFNIGPINDGWTKLDFGIDLLNFKNTRVFNYFPTWLSIRVVRNGFEGWQIVLLALSVLRSVLFYEIVKRLFPRNHLFAIACGLIALFHPADNGYFWLGCIDAIFGLVLAFACCLSALIYLQTNSRRSQISMFVFQFLSCFTYTGFLLVIVGFPMGAWIIRRIEGRKDSVFYLLKVSLPILAFIVFQAVLAFKGVGREGVILDMNLHGVWAGYVTEIRLIGGTFVEFFKEMQLAYLPAALICGGAACLIAFVGFQKNSGLCEDDESKPWWYYVLLVIGLMLLAALSYLPFAVTNIRFGNTRQLLLAGIFVYMVFLLLIIVILPRYTRYINNVYFKYAILFLVSVTTVIAGLEHRGYWIAAYRSQEQLFAAIAAKVPSPPSGAVIVVRLEKEWQSRALAGIYNRRDAFTNALRFMYGDETINANFTDFEQPPFVYAPGGAEIKAQLWTDKGLFAPYDRLILLGYTESGEIRILDRSWLQQYAPKGTDLSAYNPGDYGSLPSDHAIMCTMLEQGYRPPYCRPPYRRTSQ